MELTWDEDQVMYGRVESLNYIPETNVQFVMLTHRDLKTFEILEYVVRQLFNFRTVLFCLCSTLRSL